LSDLLEKSSKKFLKSCDEIKIINKKLSHLLNSYTQCEEEITNQEKWNEQNDTKSTTNNNKDPFFLRHDLERLEFMSQNFKCDLMRNFLSQEIEHLKNMKQVYLIYARRKASEITQLQNELYGEEAVQEAYQTVQMPSIANDSESIQEEEMEDVSADEMVVAEDISASSSSSSSTTPSQIDDQQSSILRPARNDHHLIDNPVF
jgi:hypothetical protein